MMKRLGKQEASRKEATATPARDATKGAGAEQQRRGWQGDMRRGRAGEGPIRGRGRTEEGTMLGGDTNNVVGRTAMTRFSNGGVEGERDSSGKKGVRPSRQLSWADGGFWQIWSTTAWVFFWLGRLVRHTGRAYNTHQGYHVQGTPKEQGSSLINQPLTKHLI